ncbi:WxL domain-containing protein, partial [Enterococcus mundtii]|uniref:WxL domain-containing protein n=1 Tax=Enterococcus mundtii TaxID=53346 RepID=UPI0030043520
ANESELSIQSTTGQRMNLIGSNPVLNLKNSQLDMKATTGRGIFLNGSEPEVNLIGTTMSIENTEPTTGLSVNGTGKATVHFTSSTITMNESRIEMNSNGEFIINNSSVDSSAQRPVSGFQSSQTLLPSILLDVSDSLYFHITNDSKVSIETEYGVALSTPTATTVSGNLNVDVENNSILSVSGSKMDNNAPIFLQSNQLDFNVDPSSTIEVENSGISDSTSPSAWLGNQGLMLFGSGNNPKVSFSIFGKLDINSERGTGLILSNRTSMTGTLDASLKIEENASFFVQSGSSNAIVMTIGDGTSMNSHFSINNPIFYDIISSTSHPAIDIREKNNRSNNGEMTIQNSKFSAWSLGSNVNQEPSLFFDQPLDAKITGRGNLNNVVSSSDSDFNNSTLGSQGLNGYHRIRATNALWLVADELRVPTNADKKIHGHVSVPETIHTLRPARTDEATVTVEVESPSGDKEYFTANTVGHTEDSSGISIYGEEPRGGLFEIDLDEPLEVGSKVRISKVELTSGELTDGFEHKILTDTVEVFPIIPPTPAQFSSSIIAQDSNTIQGTTDNLDAEVTATHNGEPLNTEAVMIDDDGRFTLDLSEISLEIDDEIQVFLRDVKGSALAAGVVNPPETNDTRGNINPSSELTFHDVTFEPATTLIVGDLGPVSPVDPLDPEIEVEPENKPELPEDQGQLSIDFVSSFNFGSQAISVQDKTYYAQPQRLLNEDGTVNENEERPNYVQISDRRLESERNGWELAVTQKEQFKGDQNQVLNGASLSLSNQQVITAQGGTVPGLQSVPCTLVPGNRRTLLKAQRSEGTGTWIYRFGDGETAGGSVALDVPRGANPEATTYSSTLIWELSAVPGN